MFRMIKRTLSPFSLASILITALLHPPLANAASPSEPIVLELFTSQGCSSCPPADALLKAVSEENPRVLALSFHVHYWDYLGWKDPFSSPAFTERQRIYATRLSAGNIFTPQLIVNGAASVVGSDEASVRKALQVFGEHALQLEVAVQRSATGLTADVRNLGADSARAPADVLAVYFNKSRSTDVERGENAGRRVENINNVTSVRKIGEWTGAGGLASFPVPIEPQDGMAILLQSQKDERLLGAGVYRSSENATGSNG